MSPNFLRTVFNVSKLFYARSLMFPNFSGTVFKCLQTFHARFLISPNFLRPVFNISKPFTHDFTHEEKRRKVGRGAWVHSANASASLRGNVRAPLVKSAVVCCSFDTWILALTAKSGRGLSVLSEVNARWKRCRVYAVVQAISPVNALFLSIIRLSE